MQFKHNDGGRSDCYKGHAGDCVVRAIAIATGELYQDIYNALRDANTGYSETRRTRVARSIKRTGTTPRNGNFKQVYRPYLESLGWVWVPTMFIGQGCKVHLKSDELPGGVIIVKVSKHLTAVIDGIINDTYDCSRDGTRCVYGYFIKDNK